MRILWIEQGHPGLGYYDALYAPLKKLGHNLTEWKPRRGGELLNVAAKDMDVAFVSFGFFPMESGSIPKLREYEKAASSSATSLCGRVPLYVLLNKEYVLMSRKFEWLKAHCVTRGLTVHHHAERFANETGIPFTRIWFGVDVNKFALPGTSGDTSSGALASHNYLYDLGFTGVIRHEQTENWRYRIWRYAWPKLQAKGLRLFSGPRGGVHVGVAHASMNASEYVHSMRASKIWLSTTGPADLVGTRYFEVMATGTTLCLCNRVENEPAIYTSLGLKDHVHVLMFDSLTHLEELVYNFTMGGPVYEAKRLAIVRRAQALVRKRFTWQHVAERVAAALV